MKKIINLLKNIIKSLLGRKIKISGKFQSLESCSKKFSWL